MDKKWMHKCVQTRTILEKTQIEKNEINERKGAVKAAKHALLS